MIDNEVIHYLTPSWRRWISNPVKDFGRWDNNSDGEATESTPSMTEQGQLHQILRSYELNDETVPKPLIQ